MNSPRSLADKIHQKALEISTRYKNAEAELIEVLQEAEQHKVFLSRGHSSLFLYVVHELGLSESVAYNLITVSRKAREVPALKTEIKNGSITLSNARKIAPVLTRENQSEWLKKASLLSQRELEKEIVKVCPQAATPERASYVTPTRINLNVGLFEKDMIKFRRIQDLVSQAKRSSVSLEEVLVDLFDEYLNRHDPIEKAKRQKVRTNLTKQIKTPVALQVGKRVPIPATIRHQVTMRDQRQCTFVNDKGNRCLQKRWIEIHHKVPVSQGGTNTLENLTTLCSSHHDLIH